MSTPAPLTIAGITEMLEDFRRRSERVVFCPDEETREWVEGLTTWPVKVHAAVPPHTLLVLNPAGVIEGCITGLGS